MSYAATVAGGSRSVANVDGSSTHGAPDAMQVTEGILGGLRKTGGGRDLQGIQLMLQKYADLMSVSNNVARHHERLSTDMEHSAASILENLARGR